MAATQDGASDRESLLSFVLHHLRVQIGVCGPQRVVQGYVLPLRTVLDWNFIYVTRGKAVWVIEDVEYAMGAGDLVVVPPGVEHHAFSRTQRMQLMSIHVEPKLPGGQDVFGMLTPPRFMKVAAGSNLDRYLRGAEAEMDRLAGQGAVSRLYVAAWARMAVLEILRCHTTAAGYPMAKVHPLLVRILQLLDERATRTLTLDELAHRVGYSAQHLNRLFRQQLGVTPLQHHRRLKLERAAELLVRGGLTVQGVARAVGIEDGFYFSRIFQQHFGMSPTEYRRSVESEADGERG